MIDIPQISHLEKLVALTRLYLELRLPLAGALRAATADLQMESLPDATQQWSSASRLSGKRYIHVVGSIGLSKSDGAGSTHRDTTLRP
jgi:hypothetical protein